jgi:hypothetical protein
LLTACGLKVKKHEFYLERETIWRILVYLLPFLKGKHIRWFTDNQNVVLIVNKGWNPFCKKFYTVFIFNV